jgi:hypothetical protein
VVAGLSRASTKAPPPAVGLLRGVCTQTNLQRFLTRGGHYAGGASAAQSLTACRVQYVAGAQKEWCAAHAGARDYTIRLGEKCTVRFMDKEIGSFDTYDGAMAFARSHDNEQPIRCSFEGCWRTTWQPYTDGWAGLASLAGGPASLMASIASNMPTRSTPRMTRASLGTTRDDEV